MAGQLWALVVVKWQIARHTFSASTAIAMILAGAGTLLATLGAGALGVGLYLLATRVLAGIELLLTLLVLDGLMLVFLLVWFWGALLEIQRSEAIDLRKMLYLPVSLPMVFLLNFAVSLLGLPAVLFLPAVTGLIIGLGHVHGISLPGGLAFAAVFFLMLSAWAYYFRGLLAILMENKRRRRILMTLLPLGFVLMAQIPNLVVLGMGDLGEAPARQFSSFHPQADMIPWILWANMAFPPAWLPLGVWYLLDGQAGPAAFCLAGLTICTGAGLALGYRSTRRYYVDAAKARVARPGKRRRTRTPLTARRIPLLAADTAAATSAAFLTFARHPNIRMMLLAPLCLGAFFLFFYGSNETWADTRMPWFPVVLLVWPFMNFGFILLNLFGVDRQSFRALVLLPTPRHRYILAKNIALFPFVGGLSLLFVTGGAFLLEQSPQWMAIAVLQVFQIYLSFCIVGNFSSLYFPYRIQHEAIRGQGNRPLMILIGLGSALVVGLLMVPSAFCLMLDSLYEAAYGAAPLPLGVVLSLGLLACTGLIYAWSLRHAGDLLLQREHRILEVLVRDRE